jgi:hypothetical protein
MGAAAVSGGVGSPAGAAADGGGGAAMIEDDDDASERQYREQRKVNSLLFKEAKQDRKRFDKIITRLWIANGGGAVVTMNYIANSHKHASVSLLLFVAGLMSLATLTVIDI